MKNYVLSSRSSAWAPLLLADAAMHADRREQGLLNSITDPIPTSLTIKYFQLVVVKLYVILHKLYPCTMYICNRLVSKSYMDLMYATSRKNVKQMELGWNRNSDLTYRSLLDYYNNTSSVSGKTIILQITIISESTETLLNVYIPHSSTRRTVLE